MSGGACLRCVSWNGSRQASAKQCRLRRLRLVESSVGAVAQSEGAVAEGERQRGLAQQRRQRGQRGAG
eukprot:9722733-Lingulodinium_polyedra.AAC.1